MKDQRALINTAVSSLLALGIAASAASASAADEKCFGVAKAGQNACNSNASKHSCAGHAKVDYDSKDFVTLPAGNCQKIGGKLTPSSSKPAPAGKA